MIVCYDPDSDHGGRYWYDGTGLCGWFALVWTGVRVFLDSLTSAEGLVLPESIGGIIFLINLRNADGLKLPYGFDLNKLECPYNIKEEIINNPDKYYMAPTEEDKKEIKR